MARDERMEVRVSAQATRKERIKALFTRPAFVDLRTARLILSPAPTMATGLL